MGTMNTADSRPAPTSGVNRNECAIGRGEHEEFTMSCAWRQMDAAKGRHIRHVPERRRLYRSGRNAVGLPERVPASLHVESIAGGGAGRRGDAG